MFVEMTTDEAFVNRSSPRPPQQLLPNHWALRLALVSALHKDERKFTTPRSILCTALCSHGPRIIGTIITLTTVVTTIYREPSVQPYYLPVSHWILT